MEIYLNDLFIYWKCLWSDTTDLHSLLQNLNSKIKSTMEHSFKELLFLDIYIKNENS